MRMTAQTVLVAVSLGTTMLKLRLCYGTCCLVVDLQGAHSVLLGVKRFACEEREEGDCEKTE